MIFSISYVITIDFISSFVSHNTAEIEVALYTSVLNDMIISLIIKVRHSKS